MKGKQPSIPSFSTFITNTPHSTPHGQLRHEQFQSLVMLTSSMYITCSECGDRYFSQHGDEAGFNVVPLTDGTYTVPAAIARSFTE